MRGKECTRKQRQCKGQIANNKANNTEDLKKTNY